MNIVVKLTHISNNIQEFTNQLGLGPKKHSTDTLQIYDLLVTDVELRDTTMKLFIEQNYALAVEEAYKFLNNLVKHRSGLKTDGAKLMKAAFSQHKPRLRINPFRTQSQIDQQIGYMEIFSGCMTGIRNPRAHEHKYLDDSEIALEMLAWANHLTCIVRKAIRTRRR